ncbi:MAG: hypothetical protein K6C68_01630 [Ruminococcus sp.]|nr:hypothetical protein [Ruminococcus sp.]
MTELSGKFYTDTNGNTEFPLRNRQAFMLRLEQQALEKYGKREGNGNCGQGMRVRFPIDEKRLEKAIRRVINENDALRLILVDKKNTPIPQVDNMMQKVVLDPEFTLETYTVNGDTEEERLAAAVEVAKNEMHKAIDYFNELSIKLFLIKMAEDDYLLVWIAHHWIGDGSTSGLVLDQVFRYYSDPDAETLPHASFIDFISEEKEFLNTEKGQKQLEYWRSEVDGYELLDLSRAAIGEPGTGEDQFYKIPMADPERVSKKFNTSCFNVILLGYHLGVSILLDTKDTIIGVTSANRMNKKYFHTMGYFAHSTQHRIIAEDSDRLSDLIELSKNKFSSNMANLQTAYYYDKMQFCLTYQNFVAGTKTKEQNITPVSIPSKRVVDQFFMLVFEGDTDMTFVMVGNGNIFTTEFDRSLKRYIELTVELLENDPDATVADLKKRFSDAE